MSKLIRLIILIGSLILSAIVGYNVATEVYQDKVTAPQREMPEVIYVPDIRYITREIPVYRLEIKEVEKPVYIGTGELREFESVDDLRFWLNRTGINEREYIPEEYDCDDFAIDLVKLALKDGYWLGLVDDGEHIYNFTIIANRIYWIEPQSNVKDIQIRRYGQLD